MKKSLLLLPFVLLLMACPQKQKLTPLLTINLPSKWRIIEFETNGKKHSLNSKSYIDFREEKLGSVYIGCNIGNFKFDLGGDEFSIKINQIMSTRMYCEEKSKTESALFTAMKKIDSYRCGKETLYLINTTKNLVIKCEPFKK